MSSTLEYVDKSLGTLPDGKYFGSFGGSIVEVSGTYKGQHQIIVLRWKQGGVKGFGYKVIVTVKGDNITFEHAKDENGKNINNFFIHQGEILPRQLISANF